jgi:hypothetical protein
MEKVSEFGNLIGISPSTLQKFTLEKYKDKVKLIVQGIDVWREIGYH